MQALSDQLLTEKDVTYVLYGVIANKEEIEDDPLIPRKWEYYRLVNWQEVFKMTDYDDSYGEMYIYEIYVCGNDWWLERHEYDGSEWWEFKSLPEWSNRYLILKGDAKR